MEKGQIFLLDDGKGTDILGSVKNGAYFIGGGGQPPTVSFTYVPDDYPTIQAAVNAASAGDTIIVRDGTYNENVKGNKRLTIQSENGADSTIVQAANSTDYVFEVTADYVNISGFTVEGALHNWNAGMYITANYCNISNNKASNNAIGIRLEHSNPITFPSYNIIKNNTCSNNGEGIHLGYSNNNSICNNRFLKNNANGIILYTSSNNSISNNIYTNNGDGIELWLYSNYNIISDNDIYSHNYGIELRNSNNNLIYLNDFRNNADNVYYNESANLWDSPEKITYTYAGSQYTNYLGNYWDDYSGTDANGDGIGDTPYRIESDKDNYPLITPWQDHIGVPATRTNAELFLSPATKTVNVGDSFSVDVLVNTGGQNVVVVGAYLNYDPTKLEVIGIDNSNSVFTMPIEKTADPTTGMIKLAFGKPTPGVNTASGNVATINFKAIAQASAAYVSFVTDSDMLYTCVLIDDGKGTDILGSVKNGDYFIGGGAQPPTVTSTGTISVSSSPSGAGITLDGVPINAITPHTITYVEPGYHTIKLTLESYQDWSTEVYVIAGETSHVHITLAETSTP
jgi:parallel beta-helix repeat protein